MCDYFREKGRFFPPPPNAPICGWPQKSPSSIGLNNNVTYFDCFGVEHIPKKIKHFIGNKNMKANIYRIQAYKFRKHVCLMIILLLVNVKFQCDTGAQSLTPYLYDSHSFTKLNGLYDI